MNTERSSGQNEYKDLVFKLLVQQLIHVWVCIFNDLRKSISCTAGDLENYISSPASLREVMLALCLQYSSFSVRDEL